MEKISAVYKIVNTVTGEFYIGSSKDVKRRWEQHRYRAKLKKYSNSPLYQDMEKYGIDKFRFQILAPVMEEYLKQVEQEFIELLNPTYNDRNSNGLDVERQKATSKKYDQSEKGKATRKKYRQSEKGKVSRNKYHQSEKGKVSRKKYSQSERGKVSQRKYKHQLCEYNGETLTLDALRMRFRRAGISHPNIEAKKYLINE